MLVVVVVVVVVGKSQFQSMTRGQTCVPIILNIINTILLIQTLAQQCSAVASRIHTKKTRNNTPQMATKYTWDFLEGQNNNEKVRAATALRKLEDIIRCRLLRCLGHLS